MKGQTSTKNEDSEATTAVGAVVLPVVLCGFPKPGKMLSVSIAAFFLASGTATSNTQRPLAREIREVPRPTSASSNPLLVWRTVKGAPPSMEPTPDIALSVRDLHDQSGLTWDQLSRLFGVSRRAVHNWATGGRMTANNVRLLSALRRVIGQLQGTDPASRRAIFLAPGQDGRSPFDRFREDRVRLTIDINGSPLAPDQLLGVARED